MGFKYRCALEGQLSVRADTLDYSEVKVDSYPVEIEYLKALRSFFEGYYKEDKIKIILAFTKYIETKGIYYILVVTAKGQLLLLFFSNTIDVRLHFEEGNTAYIYMPTAIGNLLKHLVGAEQYSILH